MSCISWNARGLGNQRAFRELKRLLAERNPTLLFLCETKRRDSNFTWWKDVLGYSGMFVVNCVGRSGGLALLVPELHGIPWLVGGDFNEISSDSEKFGGNRRPAAQTRAFRDTLSDCGLQDLHGSGDLFTWVNRRSPEHIIIERLDRFVANFEWRLLYPVAKAQSLDFYHSDHRPILLELGKTNDQLVHRGHAFRFEPHWVTKEECKDIVELGWQKLNISLTLQDRILSCKQALQTWAGNRFRNLPRKLKHKRMQLHNLKTRDKWMDNVQQINSLEKEIEILAHKEEMDKNHIRGLVSSHGDWCTEEAQMSSIIEDYFTNLFASNNPTLEDRRNILDCVEPIIDEHMNSILNASFSAAEIKMALFDMHPDKAPGSDGMSVFFYQKFWNSIGGEVIEAVQRILNDGQPLDAWNDTIVNLIPKIKSPMTMKDFRPISLCNVCYNIVARTLTNRLRPILKQTVNDFQSAFIQDRLISDNIIQGFETIHWIRSRKGGHKGYAALKLEMSKAYVRVEWSFLEGIMIQLGVSHIWVEKVMRCVRSVKYSFCVNGVLSGGITPSRDYDRVIRFLHTYLYCVIMVFHRLYYTLKPEI
ncbi:uncharacterized protein LOC142556916 [Primulina tabacum]|uniref:uncharacterized protein LOC142556916 n=1 Tax=Primulina tabacum TaxID=48773 RepID=UPI003F5A3FF7